MLGFLYVFHIPIDELTKKLRFLAITVQGRLAIPLLGFLYVFLTPIDELTKKLRLIAIAILHHPP